MIKKVAPVYLYMTSVVCFVIANLVRDQFLELYYILLIVGVVLCILGFKNRIQK